MKTIQIKLIAADAVRTQITVQPGVPVRPGLPLPKLIIQPGDQVRVFIDGKEFQGDPKSIDKLKSAQIKKMGSKLQLLLDEQVVAEVEDFYAYPDVSLYGSEWTYAADSQPLPCPQTPCSTSTTPAETPPLPNAEETDTGAAWWHWSSLSPMTKIGVGALGVLALSGGGGGGSSAPAPASPQLATVEGAFVAGPVTNAAELSVQIFDQDGNLIGSAPLNSDGTYSITLTREYSGNVLVKLIDAGTGEDYIDEATAAAKDLSLDILRAVGVVTAGQTSNIYITPLSELAVRELLNDDTGSVTRTAGKSADQMTTASKAALDALGFTGATFNVFTDKPEPKIDTDGQLREGNEYGAALAALSAYESKEVKKTEDVFAQARSANASSADMSLSMAKAALAQWNKDDADSTNKNLVREVLGITTGVPIPEEKIDVVLGRIAAQGVEVIDSIDTFKELADTTAPTVTSVSANGNTVTITLSEAVLTTPLPDAGSFKVTFTNDLVNGTPREVAGINNLQFSTDGKAITLTLTLAEPVKHGHQLTLSYTAPDASPNHVKKDNQALQDAAGNDLVSFNSRAVTNNTPNTAPTLNANLAAESMNAIDEDQAYGATGVTGATKVAELIGATNLSDADFNAKSGIAIVGLGDLHGGTFAYSLNNGSTWISITAAETSNALLLPDTAYLRFQPLLNWNGSIADLVTFKAWDQTTGTAGGRADTTTSGGSTAFSVATDTASITVNAVNDAPVNTMPSALSIREDAMNVAITGLKVDDVDAGVTEPFTVVLKLEKDSAGFGALTIAGDVASGLAGTGIVGSGTHTVTLTGTLAQINATLAAGGAVKYTPPANGHGSVTLTMTSTDSGTQGSGGVKSHTSSLAFEVSAVNDAPTSQDNTVVLNELDAIVFTTQHFNFQDIAADGHTLLNVIITELPESGKGTLQLNGVNVVAGQSISRADIEAGKLTFVPVQGESTSFKFKVQDNGGTANGGVDTSAAYTFNLSRDLVVQSFTVTDSDTTSNTNTVGRVGEALTFTVTFSEPVTSTVGLTAVFTINGQDVTVTANAVTNSRTVTFTGASVPGVGNDGAAISLKSLTADSGSITGQTTGKTLTPPVAGAITHNGYTVDNTPPAATTSTVALSADTAPEGATDAALTSDWLTKTAAQTLSGALDAALGANETVEVSVNGTYWTAATITVGSTNWTLANQTLQAGSNTTIKVRVRDAAGHEKDLASQAYELDTTPPEFAAGATPLALESDTGSNTTDNVTSNGKVLVAGLEAGATWQYKVGNGTYTNGTGTSFDVTQQGQHTVTVRQFDKAGNASDEKTLTFTLDSLNPTVTANYNVDENTVADQTPKAINLAVTDATDVTWSNLGGTDASHFTLGTGTNAGKLLFNAGADFETKASYRVTVTATDAAGNTTDQALTINVNNVNEAPVITMPNDFEALEDATNIYVTGISIADDAPADALLEVTVEAQGGGEDVGVLYIAADVANGLTASGIINNGTNQVTLKGTLAQINATLASSTGVRYAPKANFNGSMTVSMLVNDLGHDDGAEDGFAPESARDNVIINVKPVNDAPTASDVTLEMAEDTVGFVLTLAHFGFADAKDTPANTLNNVIITELPVVGSFTLDGAAVTVGQVISKANIQNGHLKFQPAANGFGDAYATVKFKVQDDGGTTNGGQDTSDPKTITFKVNAVNDLPTTSYDGRTITWVNGVNITLDLKDFFDDVEDGPNGLTFNNFQLPPGITMDPVTYVLSGTPTSLGLTTFKVTAIDRALGRSEEVTFNINVQEPLFFELPETEITALDVDGQMVISANSLAGTPSDLIAQAGGKIRLVHTTDASRTQEIDVTDTRFVTISDNRVIIKPPFDFDFGGAYRVEVDADAFTATVAGVTGTESRAMVEADALDFGTVSLEGANNVANAKQGQVVNDDGTVANGKKWIDGSGQGDWDTGTTVDFDLAGGDYAVVVKDGGTSAGRIDTGDGVEIKAGFNLGLSNVGSGDHIYVDDTANDKAALNNRQFTQITENVDGGGLNIKFNPSDDSDGKGSTIHIKSVEAGSALDLSAPETIRDVINVSNTRLGSAITGIERVGTDATQDFSGDLAASTTFDVKVTATLRTGDKVQLVRLDADGNEVNWGAEVTVGAQDITNGHITLSQSSLTDLLQEPKNTIYAKITGADGAVTKSAMLFGEQGGFDYDTTPPAPVLAVADTENDLTPEVSEDKTLTDTETSVRVQVEGWSVGDVYKLLLGNTELKSETITQNMLDSNGDLFLSINKADLGGAGTKSISVSITDRAGNTGTAAAALELEVLDYVTVSGAIVAGPVMAGHDLVIMA